MVGRELKGLNWIVDGSVRWLQKMDMCDQCRVQEVSLS